MGLPVLNKIGHNVVLGYLPNFCSFVADPRDNFAHLP